LLINFCIYLFILTNDLKADEYVMLYFRESIYSDFIDILHERGLYICRSWIKMNSDRFSTAYSITQRLINSVTSSKWDKNYDIFKIYIYFNKEEEKVAGFESRWETSWICKKWLMDIDSHASIFYIVRLPWTLALRWPTVNQDKACYKKSHVNHKILQ
jgi:hypothetical protein